MAKEIVNNSEDTELYHAQSKFKVVMKRLSKNKLAMFGLVVLVILIILAFCGEAIAPYSTIEINFQNKLLRPTAEHPFGCDEFGRDILSRLMGGTRFSMILGFGTTAMALIIGVVLGSIAGYFGGRIDNYIMRFLDIFQSIPGMLMSIVISAVLGTGLFETVLALALTHVPNFARILRASIMTIRKMEYLEAAESINCSPLKSMLKHILPNAFTSLLVTATLCVAGSISQAAGLSFVGLGVQPPTPEWGAILSGSRTFMRDYPHMVIFPGLVLAITNFSLNLLGDGLRDALDPKLKR